jgi:hypothetical protein
MVPVDTIAAATPAVRSFIIGVGFIRGMPGIIGGMPGGRMCVRQVSGAGVGTVYGHEVPRGGILGGGGGGILGGGGGCKGPRLRLDYRDCG